MPKNTYELTYIVNGVLNDDQIKGLVNRVHKFIDENGASILHVDEWGTRRLAYPINKKRNGYYVNLYFESEGDLIARLERALQIEDDILRHLTLKMDAKMLQNWEEQKAGVKKRAEEEASASRGKSGGSAEDEDEDEDEE